jgi:hypothetical protein
MYSEVSYSRCESRRFARCICEDAGLVAADTLDAPLRLRAGTCRILINLGHSFTAAGGCYLPGDRDFRRCLLASVILEMVTSLLVVFKATFS